MYGGVAQELLDRLEVSRQRDPLQLSVEREELANSRSRSPKEARPRRFQGVGGGLTRLLSSYASP
jgi:hypothetical protein